MSTSPSTSASSDNQWLLKLFPNHGITRSGFSRPHIDEIEEVIRALFERNLGYPIPSPESLEGQVKDLWVLMVDTQFQINEATYYGTFFEWATGAQLDALLGEMGYQRIDERQATGEVTLFAPNGGNPSDETIPARTRVATAGDASTPPIYYETRKAVTLPAGAAKIERVPIIGPDPLNSTINLSDEQTGSETNVQVGAISQVVDGVNGAVNDVTNPLPTGGVGKRQDGSGENYDFIRGRDREEDMDYKRRYLNSLGVTGVANLDAIEAGIRTAGDGDIVLAATVNEHLDIYQDGTDAGGDPVWGGREVAPIVVLNEDSEAAYDAVSQAIYDETAGGIESVGELSGTAINRWGEQYSKGLAFTPAVRIPIHITADLLVTDEFPADGKEQIKTNLISTIGGVYSDGQRAPGKDIGIDVRYGEVLGDVLDHQTIPGIIDHAGSTPGDGIKTGTSANPTSGGDIVIASDEVPRTSPSNIIINVTPVEES